MDDKKYIKIEEDLLKQVLSEAFETGWSGFKDLQDETVDNLFKRCESKNIESTDISAKVVEGESVSTWSQLQNPYIPYVQGQETISNPSYGHGSYSYNNVPSMIYITSAGNTVNMADSTLEVRTTVDVENLPDDLSDEDAATIRTILDNHRR